MAASHSHVSETTDDSFEVIGLMSPEEVDACFQGVANPDGLVNDVLSQDGAFAPAWLDTEPTNRLVGHEVTNPSQASYAWPDAPSASSAASAFVAGTVPIMAA